MTDLDHENNVTQSPAVSLPTESEEGQSHDDTQTGSAEVAAQWPTPLLLQIRETHRLRQDLHSAEKRLVLQIKSICRRLVTRPGMTLPAIRKEGAVLYRSIEGNGHHELALEGYGATQLLMPHLKTIRAERKKPEKLMQQLATELPVWPWWESIHGVGALGLAQIVAEAGDLSNYANPAKLWKRLGVGVIDGEAQGRRTDPIKAKAHGFAPPRRAVLFCIGDALIRANGEPYYSIYLQRKEYETPRVKTKKHAHFRAKRYMEKRLIRDLWEAWQKHDQTWSVNQSTSVP